MKIRPYIIVIIVFSITSTLIIGMLSKNFYNKSIDVSELPNEKSIVYFYKEGCPACGTYTKNLNEFISSEEIIVYSINVEEYGEEKSIALDINVVPTTLFLDSEGDVAFKVEGIITAEEIKEYYDKT